MAKQSCCRSGADGRVDLLPWADPYIVQLFAEAGMVTETRKTQSPLKNAWQDARATCGTDIEAMSYSRARRVRPTDLSRPASRRRRTESARSLARCKAPVA